MSNPTKETNQQLEEAQALAEKGKQIVERGEQVVEDLLHVLEAGGGLGGLGGEVLMAVTQRLALAEEAIDQLVQERDEARKLVGILLGQLRGEA
jgi:exonuclease VII small subunit